MSKKTKIALIEDDQTISQMYRIKFETCGGYDVQLAENGVDGIKLVQKFNPDIILLDLRMPTMDGDECLAEIRKHNWGKDIPVLILTNIGIEEAPAILKTLNVANYVVKAEATPKQVVALVETTISAHKNKNGTTTTTISTEITA